MVNARKGQPSSPQSYIAVPPWSTEPNYESGIAFSCSLGDGFGCGFGRSAYGTGNWLGGGVGDIFVSERFNGEGRSCLWADHGDGEGMRAMLVMAAMLL